MCEQLGEQPGQGLPLISRKRSEQVVLHLVERSVQAAQLPLA